MTTLMVLSDPELIKFDSSLPAFRCSVGLYRPLGRSKQEEGAECSGMDIVSKDINWAQHFSFLLTGLVAVAIGNRCRMPLSRRSSQI